MFGFDIFGLKRRRREREAAAEAERQRLRGRVGLVGREADAIAAVDRALAAVARSATTRPYWDRPARSASAPAPSVDLLNPLNPLSPASPLHLVSSAESYSSRHDEAPASRHDSAPSSRCGSDDSWSRSSGCDSGSWGGSDSSSSSSSSSSDSSY
ncbi:hypothetical protein QU926_27440 [Pseudomonas asiatica]|uniref:hypothetical protein n=1 Tax=Pseudomonas asiatica TaxID=2219225 RepID=UPI0025AA4358|nr:hypothetical protein [Pseudomonas asiatica]MDM9557353.1 hypothetical protein [Pseudomonas asiatica]